MPVPAGIDLIYCPSDFLHDLIPAVHAKRLRPDAKLVVCLLLRAPPPWRGYRYGLASSGIARPTARSAVFYATQQVGITLLKRYADLVFVLNSDDRAHLVRRGIPPRKVVVTSMGVDLASFASAQEGQCEALRYDGVFVGRIHPQKGVPDLLAAWRHVVRECPGARLALIGGGNEASMRMVRNAIAKYGLDGVVDFLGFRHGREKIGVLQASRCFIFPSTYESWGMAACEAMACGLPVVAYDLPLYREIFPGGMIMAPLGDAEALAAQIVRVLRMPADDYEALRAEARDTARLYDWVVVSTRDWDIMESLFQRE